MLDTAFDVLAGVSAELPADVLDAPTPCSEWTVAQVLWHTAADLRAWAHVVGGAGAPDVDAFDPPRSSSITPAALIDPAIDVVRDAWSRVDSTRDAVPTPLPPFPTMFLELAAAACALEVAIHAWDLALAAGGRDPLTDALAAELDVAARTVADPLRGFAYADALRPDPSDGAAHAVLRFLGRDPHWSPSGPPPGPRQRTVVPPRYSVVDPWVISPDTAAEIDFLVAVFDAVEDPGRRVRGLDGRIGHAEVDLGDKVIMLFDSAPGWPGTTSHLRVYVADAAATFARALDAGARPVTEPTVLAFGDRVARFRDPQGHLWWLHEHLEDVDPERLGERFADPAAQEAMSYVQHGLGAEMTRYAEQGCTGVATSAAARSPRSRTPAPSSRTSASSPDSHPVHP